MSATIGIDLGTTYSCVAVFRHGKVEVIANDHSNRTTPSYVAFTDTERLIGDAAKAQAAMNPKNTVFDVKRLIGRPYDDDDIQQDIKNWPFTVVDDNGKPRIEVEYKGELKRFTPEEISAMLLTKMKETAEVFLGSKVTDAVITVPAYFSNAQRQATKNAGRIAGLNVKRIIPEPTAAALAYGLENKLSGEQKILVFDLGGGTFDVSIVSVTDGPMLEVLSTAGNAHLGGEDFDNIMFNHLVDEFKRINGKDLRGDARAMRRLRTACETAKRTLSCSAEASIAVEALYQGIDFHIKVSQGHFEEICMDLFQSTLELVEQALEAAKIDKSDIQEIVLVGGSTRIPMIQRLVQEFFGGKTLSRSINADEAVAHGAALQAAILSGDSSTALQEVLLVDVTPLSLGIETTGGAMSKLIERNTPIPTKEVKTFTTFFDNQTEVNIAVYEGERIKVKDNTPLCRFSLTDIRPAPRGAPNIEVTFELDSNGILDVKAHDKGSGRSKSVSVNYYGVLSSTEIEEMIAQAERYRAEDNAERERIVARSRLERFIISIRQKVMKTDAKLDESQRQRGTELYIRAFKWLDGNLSAEQDQFEQQLQKLQSAFSSFMV